MALPQNQRPVIDCDADPFVPEGYALIEHIKSGKIPSDTLFGEYRLESQLRRRMTLGREIYPEIRKTRAANANVLDSWLAHPGQIPAVHRDMYENTDPLYQFFWGSIYARVDRPEELFVRYLRFWKEKPESYLYSLDNEFPFHYPGLAFTT